MKHRAVKDVEDSLPVMLIELRDRTDGKPRASFVCLFVVSWVNKIEKESNDYQSDGVKIKRGYFIILRVIQNHILRVLTDFTLTISKGKRIIKVVKICIHFHVDEISDQTYVLDVELEVLRVTEGGFQRLYSEILASLVGETHQELHDLIGRKLCSYYE